MTKYWLNAALLRVVLPVILAGCTIWRPTGLSIIYLGLMLYSPMVPIQTNKTMMGHTGIYLKTCICLAFLVVIAQITFHIVLLSLPPYGYFLENCVFLEKLFRHIGFVRLDSASVWEVFYWLSPEFIVLPTVLAVYFISRFLTQRRVGDEENEAVLRQENNSQRQKTEDNNTKIINFLGSIGTYVVLASLCCVAALRPSIEAAFYYLVFLGAATCWACNKELRKGFAVICRIIMVIVIVHIVILLAYQNEWPQEIILESSAWPRYLALVAVYHTNCSDPRNVEYINDADWLIYGYALRLFWLYYILALQSQFLSRKPLMRFGSGRTGLLQDSTTGSIIVNQDGQQDDNIQMQSLSEGTPDETPGIVEQIIMAVYSIFQLIVNSSYLATNIIMMTWSIMYHSWTTFVLLLWALILWMVPNKRASMMKCSPFIVFYATLLLLGQFIYSMDLNDEELPKVISGVQMSEIGFTKADDLGRWHLIVKCAFITMFWITMRQYMTERKQQRRSSTLRDMVAPLHVSVSMATTTMGHEAPTEIKSQFMKNVGKLLQDLLTRFWIAVVAIMLFICGITGERMTMFRIVYMSLFLIFVITFQISWTAWRKMMYIFWVTVIGYSIIMLILVYTYQFQNFPKYWEAIGVEQNLQMDIGLETYAIKDLFVRLLTPTCFVIITVLQIHYFHKDFLEVTNIDRLGPESSFRCASLGHSPSLNIPVASPADITLTDDEKHTIYTLKQLKHMSKLERIALLRKLSKHFVNFYNYIWLFLEIHMQKIVFVSFVLLCINDVCAINFFFIVVVVIMINFNRNIQIKSINIMAAIVSLLIVTKMLYQIKYINHKNWDVNCTRIINETVNGTNRQDTINHTYNIAKWFGMDKALPGMLPDLLKGYIGIITVTTLRKIIRIRQWFYRHSKGEPLETPQIMFPTITRMDADKGIPECLKFLFNYGFYKFGLEMCLFGIVTLIGTRLDFYSVLYSVWLLVFFSLKRKTVSRIWPCFRAFAIILLPIQYAIVVAPPSWLCIDYPWDDPEMRQLQDWMYFPDPDYPPNSKKLICDFILLMMIVRQSLVFQIEQKHLQSGKDFAAGHNYSVFQDMEKPNFVNPVKDYVSHIHSWLDIIKRAVMMSLMWITLSIMFLAGTKRTNLFSLGYLIGAFIFLWQGSNFYLRPMRTILKWWNMLIGYSVIVIFTKAILQGVGCVLINDLEKSACELVQLLGIACLKKFKSSIQSTDADSKCYVTREDIGMVWDGLCFAFLLIQKRLFKSYYFFHVIDETKAMSILASRGAELLEDLHQKRIEIQENKEKKILENLKFKMDKIKANQQRIQRPSYREPESHKIDELYPGTRPLYKIRPPRTNREAIRSGDYYMFDDLDDDDVTDLIPDNEVEKKEKELRREQEKRGRRMTVSEFMNTVIKTDIEIATHVAMYGGTEKDALRLRRRSVPLTRKKSSMSYLSARSETDTAMATDGPDRTSLTSVEMETEEKDPTDLVKTPSDTEDEKMEDEQSDEKDEKKKKVSFFTYLKFILVMINSTLISMTRYLNKFSKDYRLIRKILAKEKKILKEKPDFRMGMRLGINQMWQPLMQERLATNGNVEEQYDPGEGPSQLQQQDKSTLFSRALPVQQDEETTELSEVDQPPIVQFAASIWFGILAHSSLLCYFMVFLHQIKNASVLSTPLPLMVFLWGSLTIPRPSKTFWVTLIAYTEVIVIIKCIFQLEVIPWNEKVPINHPFYEPRIIGVLKDPNYALWDLLLLLMLFFHRFMLKSMGQWTAASLKSRKVISSQLATVPSKQQPLDKQQEKKDKEQESQEQEGKEQKSKEQEDKEQESKEQESKEQEGKEQEDGIQEESDSHIKEKEPEKQSLSALQVSANFDVAGNTDLFADDNKKLIAAEEEEHPESKSLTKTMNTAVIKHTAPMKDFFMKIIDPTGKEKTNVYAYMFLCDFFNFLLLIFGFSAFGTQQGDGGVTAYFQENRVPMPFLLMLLLQFALIVIDRALFLRKSILGKLIFQYCLVFGIHLWMFFILPSATERQFNENLPPQIWYMVKCFYLLLAAYQLRQGYPTRILGNFLCKKYSIVNYVLFKGFMLVPFLFELRAVMDWIWTDTSMTIMDWFKMEDIFVSIYQIKCMRGVESDYPQPRGEKKKQMSKYLVGGSVLLFIIALIWFPLLLFALGSTVGQSNLPYDVSMKIRIGPYEPIYSISAQGSSITAYTKEQYKRLYTDDLYSKKRSAVTFFENYVHSDVAAVKFPTSSGILWHISPPDKERLKNELVSNDTEVIVHVEWTVSRKTDAKDTSGVTSTVQPISLLPYVNGKLNPARQTLVDMLSEDTDATNATIELQNAFPKFLKVTARTVSPVRQLMEGPKESLFEGYKDSHFYRNLSIQLSTNKTCCDNKQWWVVREVCTDPPYEFLKNIPLNDCNYIMMFLFNDKTFPEGLSFISGFGILGLYTTAVIVISQMMRKFVSDVAPKIMFDDLPYVDRILRLCLDIYLVRESGDLCLEEDLFAKLIFLYRSPETLIRWTRPPEEGEQTDNEEEELLDEERRRAESSSRRD